MLICQWYFSLMNLLPTFKIGLFSLESSLYILDTSPLSDIKFACLFIVLSLFLRTQFWILMKSSLSTFPLMDHTFSVISNNILPKSKTWRFSLMVSSKSFIALHLDYGLFWMNFCKGEFRSRFIFLHMDIQLFQYHSLKTILFSLNCLHIFVKNQITHICLGLFLDTVFCSTSSHEHCSFTIILKIG